MAPSTEAVEFLRAFHGDKNCTWVLTAIAPERKGGIVTATFPATSWSAAAEFVERWDGERNVYFLPAWPAGMLRKKPAKGDIAHTNYLWVDLDPRAGEELTEERQRILSLLLEPPSAIPGPPTFVVDSGRGYWGFWRLADPAGVEAEDHMREMERIFGADSCHNIDRIARLPGTINMKTGERACVVSV